MPATCEVGEAAAQRSLTMRQRCHTRKAVRQARVLHPPVGDHPQHLEILNTGLESNPTVAPQRQAPLLAGNQKIVPLSSPENRWGEPWI